MPRRDRQNHNQYFNSEEMLADGFFKAMKNQGIDLESEEPREEGEDAHPFFMTQRPTQKGDESRKIKVVGGTRTVSPEPVSDAPDATAGYMSVQFLEDLAEMLTEAKTASVTAFEKYADDPNISLDVEQVIRLIERVQEHSGAPFEKFEPLKHKSGLKSRDKLENTNLVVTNTVENYQAFPIVEIRAAENGVRPAVVLTIIGQNSKVGFLATGIISAKTDFTGAEAIDYVHEAGSGGIMAVKTNRNGRWVDVSEDFSIKLRYEEFDLHKRAAFEHSIFLGEKIIEKKDFLLKQAKLEDGTVEFGLIQAFAKDSRTLDKIRDTIRVKPE